MYLIFLSLILILFLTIAALITIIVRINVSAWKYKQLIDNSGDLLFLYSIKRKKRRLEYITKSSVKFCGYKQSDFFTNPDLFSKITHPEDYPLLEYIMEYLPANNIPVVMRWIKKDGTMIWVEYKNINILNPKNEIIGNVGVIRDISHQKKEEFSLRETTKVYKELFNNATDCILLYEYTKDGVSGRFIDVNNIACKWLDYNKEEILDYSFLHILDKSKLPNLTGKLKDLSSKGKITYETDLIAKGGKKVNVEINSNVFNYKNERVILCIARDISFRKKMEKEILKNQKLESIGILSGGIAHDFNNSLSAILANVNLANFHLNNEGKLQTILADMEKEIIRTTSLTQQLLTFSKGGMPVKQSASIGDLLKETVIFNLHGTNIDCKFDIPDDLWLAEIDSGQINQVINNLIINARQAMDSAGTITIQAANIKVSEGEIPLLKMGKYIKLTIRDTGKGIPREIQNKIFDPFFTTKENGSGLGLATSYSIIKKHEGLITLESYINTGTTFYIYLPASMKKKKKEKTNGNRDIKKGKGKILVMDDQELIRNSIVEMLTFLGYVVESAEDGRQTLELYEKALETDAPFDLILMDLTIQGGLGGKETIKLLLEINPDASVVISSGYSNDPVIANYKKFGFKNVVVKPYTIEKLSKVVDETLKNNKK